MNYSHQTVRIFISLDSWFMAIKTKPNAQCSMFNVHVHYKLPETNTSRKKSGKRENPTCSICCWRFYLNSVLTPEVSMTKEVLKKLPGPDTQTHNPKWKNKNFKIMNQIRNGYILKQKHKTQQKSKTKMFRAFQSEICINLDL